MSPAPRGRGKGRRTGGGGGVARSATRQYPRSVRVNKVLREVLAEAIERHSVADERLSLLTLTDVDCDPDFHTARLLFASLDDEQVAALADARIRLQGEIARQVRLKRTPLLSFVADPAVASGNRIEEILRGLDLGADAPADDSGGDGDADGQRDAP
jgi:ribosome-binding factor A